MVKGMTPLPRMDLDSGVEDVTPSVLEWLGEQRVGAMIRVDAERMRDGQPAWTFAASGGPLDGGMRADGASVADRTNARPVTATLPHHLQLPLELLHPQPRERPRPQRISPQYPTHTRKMR
ncbi:hypothetical protein [Streptomyces sp. N50]|uniref:hypothetical protein n=1 Tax=Streptomyces sp. N50 TaxID=3081765 RepID=UPI002961EF7D|nr:hypothetical protein [Streptomyces sp. N50]WOX16256.1 hypothetical protein R2B38_46370 [Streptomyces sp. N50]